MNNKKPNFSLLRWSALFEGSSLLILLGIGLPLKYYAEMPEAVKIIGPIHGVLFLIFIVLLLSHAVKGELNIINTLKGFFASFIPFGTFIFKAKVLSK